MLSIFAFDWPTSSFADCHLAEGSTFAHFPAVSASMTRSSFTFFAVFFPALTASLDTSPPPPSFSRALQEFSLWCFSFLKSFLHLSASSVLARWINIQLFHKHLELCCLWIMSVTLFSNPFLSKVGAVTSLSFFCSTCSALCYCIYSAFSIMFFPGLWRFRSYFRRKVGVIKVCPYIQSKELDSTV